MKRQSNGSSARGIQTTDPTPASWDILDDLPHSLRQLMWTAPNPIAPKDVRTILDMLGAHDAEAALRMAIWRETQTFAEQYRRKHKADLPHQAAGATYQPYGPLLPLPARSIKRFSSLPLRFRRGRRRGPSYPPEVAGPVA